MRNRKQVVVHTAPPQPLGQTALRKLGEKLLDAQKRYQESYAEISRLAVEWVAATCPFKAGDITTVHAHLHSGKQMRIDKVLVEVGEPDATDTFPAYWRVRGTVLRKDGHPTQYTAEMNQLEYESEKRRQPLPATGKIAL